MLWLGLTLLAFAEVGVHRVVLPVRRQHGHLRPLEPMSPDIPGWCSSGDVLGSIATAEKNSGMAKMSGPSTRASFPPSSPQTVEGFPQAYASADRERGYPPSAPADLSCPRFSTE